MPGIFGVFYKDGVTKHAVLENEGRKILNNLSHFSSYSNKILVGKKCMSGISVPYNLQDKGPHSIEEYNLLINIDGRIDYYLDEQGGEKRLTTGDVHRQIGRMYRAHGKNIPEYLSGSFNISIYDEKKDELIIFNDIVGNRLLYYSDHKEFLLYGPELKTFIAFSAFQPEMDTMALADLCNFNKFHGDRTLLKGVMLLPAGSVLHYKKHTTTCTHYFIQANTSGREKLSDDQIVTDGWELLNQSLKRSIADKSSLVVPISGGLDSRLILSMVQNHRIDYTCFTHADQPSCAEYKVASEVAAAMKVPEHKFLLIDPENVAGTLQWSCWLNDGVELASVSYHSATAWQYSEFAKKKNKKFDGFLNGMFGAHMSFSETYTRPEHDRNDLDFEQRYELFSHFLNVRGKPLFYGPPTSAGYFHPEFSDFLYDAAIESAKKELGELSIVGDNYSEQLDYYIRKIFLRRMMNCKDITRYFFADELIFADPDLFRFYLSIPIARRRGNLLYYQMYNKFLPKVASLPTIHTGERTVRNNVFSEQSGNTANYGPLKDKVYYYLGRLSKGLLNFRGSFSYKYPSYWFRQSNNLRLAMEQILLDDRTLQRSHLNADAVRALVRRERQGGDSYGALMHIIQIELFYRFFIERDTPPSSENVNIICN